MTEWYPGCTPPTLPIGWNKMTKPSPEEIMAGWLADNGDAWPAANAEGQIKALADAGYRIIHEDDIGKPRVRVVERVPFKIEED